MANPRTVLEQKIAHCGETLLKLPSLPPAVRQDLQHLLNDTLTTGEEHVEHSINLISIYEKSIKIINANSHNLLYQDPAPQPNPQLKQLSRQLQLLIQKLDFADEVGNKLVEVRRKILLDSNHSELIKHTLETLQLVIDGTIAERQSSHQFLDQINASFFDAIKVYQDSTQQVEQDMSEKHGITKELSGLSSAAITETNNARNLVALKRSITPLLSQIAQLSGSLQHAEQRENNMLNKLKYTNEQMTELIEETHDYRKRFEEQRHKAQLDPLTKVYNRSAFSESLESAFTHWQTEQGTLQLVLLDIDQFTTINERFGNSAGDKALKIIAQTIGKETRKKGYAARMYGDKFIVMFTEQEKSYNQKLIARVQKKVSGLPFSFRQQNITITVSVCADAFQSDDTPDDVLSRLDKGMAKLKRNGIEQFHWR
ncbi:GGDEF domain-containing protein [Vibrio profundum]|uniref:GGDEF domain-containing protein n=1 Tax=Vibrio profundum TaxID=2910247 RepID=UPI003D0DF53C